MFKRLIHVNMIIM